MDLDGENFVFPFVPVFLLAIITYADPGRFCADGKMALLPRYSRPATEWQLGNNHTENKHKRTLSYCFKKKY
jgi:hypothetical protein